MGNQHGNIEELYYHCAYAFGFVLGDGCLSYYEPRNAYSLRFGCGDTECLERVMLQILDVFPGKAMCPGQDNRGRKYYDIQIAGREVFDFFAGPTQWKQVIPQEFFSAPKEVQQELVAGLMDSDGCCEEYQQNGYWKYKVVFSNNKLELIKGLAGLWRLLGVSAGKLKETIEYTGKPQYRLSPNIYDFARECYFHCKRKQERIERFKQLRCASETTNVAPTSG
jgi:intein/homing endonuclease